MLFIVGLWMGIERSVSLWSAFRASQSHSFPLARLAGNGVTWFLNLYCLAGFCLLLLMVRCSVYGNWCWERSGDVGTGGMAVVFLRSRSVPCCCIFIKLLMAWSLWCEF